MAQQSFLDSILWRWRSWEEIKATSTFTKSNYINIFLLITFVAIAILQSRSKVEAAKKANLKKRALPAPAFPVVEELPNFDWRKTEPVQFRPFKPKYYLTMADESALENLDPNELIIMDKNYEDRVKYRRQMMTEHHDIVVNVSNERNIAPAISEMYTFLMGTYLPTKYPDMFILHETEYETGKTFMLQNLVTGELYPAMPNSASKTITLLETLGRTLDEEFLFLLPEQTEKDPKYILYAYICVCASGFDPSQKLGKRLADIHSPVPGYGEKLEGSMDRFFDKIEVGKYVRRVNWSVTTNADLYAVGNGTTHAREGETVEELEELDIEKTFVRCERQTLHRLPRTKALVFAFKTYLYPIKQIKDEGLGEELAEAIDGLKSGNVPGMHFYKRGPVWGEAVKKYLRS